MDEMIKEMLDEFDYDVFASKGLYENDDLTEKYYTVVKNYKVLLENYLMSKLPLKEMDDMIVNSGLAFVSLETDEMDFYQKFSSMKLKYVYLRNNLYVHKLSDEDINTLVGLTAKQMEKPNAELIELIERTYKDVIDAKPLGEDVAVNYKKCYGIDSSDYWLNSDELVFGVRYDEFAENGLGDGDEWMDNYNNQLEFLGKLMLDMDKNCSEILGVKVNFLYYDDASVTRSMGRR